MARQKRSGTEGMMRSLRGEPVHTWFDLGLFLDRLRDNRAVPGPGAPLEYADFAAEISHGVGFLSFYYAIDGVTVEMAKYAEVFRRLLPSPRLHFIAGHFDEHADTIIDRDMPRHHIEGINGFGEWSLYKSLFNRKLERGSPLYNSLVIELWEQVLSISERLGRVVEDNDIRLLYVANINSNPGNVALAIATVLVSEYLRIPVIANNHDFYWEGGRSEVDRKRLGLKPGARDHFFTNAHLGEVFSIIEMIYPWESRSWMSVNISQAQSRELILQRGHNPANVSVLRTAVDLDRYTPLSRPRRVTVLGQVAKLLAGDEGNVAASAIEEVIARGTLAQAPHHPMLLGARRKKKVDFVNDNIILLQPTRIITRKRIEFNFRLIARLCADPEMLALFASTPSLKLTLLVSGPVADGHQEYLDKLLVAFQKMLSQLDEATRFRVHLALLFSGIDKPAFRRAHEHPANVWDLYGIASVVMLPSETEGRGLPIIESAACGVPILTRRYDPQEVYADVIGEHLAREERFEVIEVRGTRITSKVIAQLKDRIIHPHRFGVVAENNRRVVFERYSMEALTSDMGQCMAALHRQLQPDEDNLLAASDVMARYRNRTRRSQADVSTVLNTERREYLPGYGRMGFMLMLKSLIDPSYFRVEEQLLRSMAFAFARRLVQENPDPTPLGAEQLAEFYNCVDDLFRHHKSEMPIMFDHALAYRHRNRRHYPFHDLTPQELTGVINLLFARIAAPPDAGSVVRHASPHFTNWHAMVAQCCGGAEPVIDDRDRMWRRLGENVPLAFFAGKALQLELELFVLRPIRARLGLEMHEALTARHLRNKKLATVHIFKRTEALGNFVTVNTLKTHIAQAPNVELRLLFEVGVCVIVPTGQISVGIDVRQLGRRALHALAGVRDGGGFMVTAASQAAITTDILDLERYHVGRVRDPVEANIMGLQVGDGFVQWVPAGLRSTLAYPTPIQTAASLHETLNGPVFRAACKKLGEPAVLEHLRQDAQQRSSTVSSVLARLTATKPARQPSVVLESINGVYADGLPWSGAIARVASGDDALQYRIIEATDGPQTVPELVARFNDGARRKAKLAWNGGYILNAELVGKLGLPQSYIGSPLGLIVSSGRVLCPPLFNKPAFIVGADGLLSITRVNAAGGLRVSWDGTSMTFPASAYNDAEGSGLAYYDLLYAQDQLPGRGRTLVRLAGCQVMEIVETTQKQSVPVLPVGLTLAFPRAEIPAGLTVGAKLEISLTGVSEIRQAVEAGPLLLEGGAVCIDMEVEGWKTPNSIHTQAARLDYLDMRGPKIAAGLHSDGTLEVLTVNGRIRESVGATHGDMAEILRSRGVTSAMGFDPGGSATLVVGTATANVSPYNRDYEQSIYSMDPQPRAVSNIIVGIKGPG